MLGLAAGVAVAQTGKPPARLVFPVVGEAIFENDFGDPRPQGRHEGIDIVALAARSPSQPKAGQFSFIPPPGRAAACCT
jgi:hypothetical protein